MIHHDLILPGVVSKILVGGRLKEATSLFPEKKVIFLSDENVIRCHKTAFETFPVISVGSGEIAKSFENVIKLYHALLKIEADRSCAIIGVGGGITTDITGFVASTFLRGVPFGFVATTLLAQVDAAIGGKNGVNLDGYKNMVGVIRQPEFVLCDLETLMTLDRKEFIYGFAEIVKYGAIRDQNLFTYLEANAEEALKMNMNILEKLVSESVRNKIEVVKNDEKEQGERKTLNFGHTFAHALEKLYKIPHGEAVAIGMVLAAQLSVNLGILKSSRAEQIIALLRRCNLPVKYNFDANEVVDAMKKDKKRSGDEIRFILLEDVGKAILKDIKIRDINHIINDLR